MFGDLEPLVAWKDHVWWSKLVEEHKESWSDGWNESLSGRRALLEGTCGQHDLFPDSSTAKTLPKAEMTDTAKQTACVVSETLHVFHERQQNFLTHLCLISFRSKATKWIKYTKNSEDVSDLSSLFYMTQHLLFHLSTVLHFHCFVLGFSFFFTYWGIKCYSKDIVLFLFPILGSIQLRMTT